MDKISRALDLARDGDGARKRTFSFEQRQKVEYTQTETVTVSPEWLRKQHVLSAIDDKALVDAYGLLRTRVLHRMQHENWKTLGVTSADPSVGKTVTAVNLGLSIARKPDSTALVVDADLRRPSVHKLFGIKPTLGIGECLTQKVPLEQVLVNPGIDQFVVLPGRSPLEDSAEYLASPEMRELVRDLRSRYRERVVIFDLPPILVGDDVVGFLPYLDAVMLVIEDGKTRADELSRALSLLEGANVIGTVLNKSLESAHGYGYYHYDYQ